jgi:riboflavin kinase / FMN adenylyltransferase
MNTVDPVPHGPDPLRFAPGERPRVVLTIGKLDGVHAGHRHLAALLQTEADRRGALSAAIVLHPDPSSVVSGRPVARLTTIEERCARLRAIGVEIVEPWHFTPEVAALTPAAFLDRLVERYDVVSMVVGADFAFGQGRLGNVSTLAELGRQYGFGVRVAEPLDVAGARASSRRLRTVIEEGDMALARTLLRVPPHMTGTVVHGAARGRRLGFPTINLDPKTGFVIPANGIFTVRAAWTDRATGRRAGALGVASIGVRPTFENALRLVEVHLLDFSGDLYGVDVTVAFLAYQRPELRFDSVAALIARMEADVAVARARHAREALPPCVTDDEGVHVEGRDLADLAEHAAAVILDAAEAPADDGARHPDARLIRTHIAIREDDDRRLVEQWLAVVGGSGNGQGGTVRRASVYQAGDGTLHALVWRSPGTGAGTVAAHLDRGVGTDGDGWRDARIIVQRHSPT